MPKKEQAPEPSALHSALPATGYLRLPEVLKLIPVGRTTWWNGVREGRYPPGIKLSPRTTAWSAEAIRALITELNDNASTQAER